MKKTLILTAMVSVLGIAMQASAQDRTRTSPTPTQSPSLAVPGQDNNIETFTCALDGVQLSSEGLAYYCWRKRSKGKNAKRYLIVYDANVNTHGMRAAMDMLINLQDNKSMIENRVKSPGKKAKRICQLVMGPSALSGEVACRQAISFGKQTHRIQTGSAGSN